MIDKETIEALQKYQEAKSRLDNETQELNKHNGALAQAEVRVKSATAEFKKAEANLESALSALA